MEATKEKLEISSEHRLRAENLSFDIDCWFPPLSAHTFKTKFLPLRRREADAIIAFYKTRYRLKRAKDFDLDDQRTLEELASRIDALLQRNADIFPGGAFLRLCGRSPKDGEPLDRQAVWDKFAFSSSRYQAELKNLLEIEGAPDDPNTKLCAIARVPQLRVKSGKDVLSLLLSSERVYAEMIDWTEFGEPEQLVFREWDEEMKLEYEFRVYVCNGKINAISQYDHYCFYPHLAAQKPDIEAAIQKKFAEVLPLISVSNFVVDFAYYPKTKSCALIELSPFLRCTGPALFSWSGSDGDILQKGPLEFRTLTKAREQIDSLVRNNWEKRWQTPIPNYWEFFPGPLSSEQEEGLFESALNMGSSLLSSIFGTSSAPSASSKVDPKRIPSIPLFVYGTLKKDFQWHGKYMSNASFQFAAETVEPFPLVVGESGVPYVLGDLRGTGKQIIGELYLVSEEDLMGLDEYEGLGKSYYSRVEIEVSALSDPADAHRIIDQETSLHKANIYVKNHSSTELRSLPAIQEYTLAIHKEKYRPIKHILVKQELYLGIRSDTH